MAVKDCIFTILFISGFILSILYIVGFASEDWVRYDQTYISNSQGEYAGNKGWLGLWKICKHNVTSDTVQCSHSHLAQGPVFLDVARTTACLGLVCVIIGMMSYDCQAVSERRTCKQKVLFRFQEIFFNLAGILGIQAVSRYFVDAKDHYRDHYGTYDVGFGAMIYLFLVACCLLIFVSILLWFFRPTENKSPSITITKPESKMTISGSVARKRWLSDSKMPTPADQSQTTGPKPTSVTHGDAQNDNPDNVAIKKSWAKSIVAPTQVILAIKRMKQGKKEKAGEEPIAPVQSDVQEEQDVNNKYKGIFTVNVDNRPSPAPPILSPSMATPRVRADSTSSSSSGSTIDVEAPTAVHNVKTSGKKVDSIPRPAPVVRHFSQGEEKLRARAAQSAVVVTDDASVQAAHGKSRPGISKRHMTHHAIGSQNTVNNTMSPSGNQLNIYSIPDEPGASSTVPPPPTYDAVMGRK